MGVLDIIMDSLEYPLKDWWKYLILGIFLVVMRYIQTFTSYKPISLFVMLVVWVLEIIIFGYFCSVVAGAIRHNKGIPSFSFVENIVDGLKYLVLGLIYSIIPLILIFVSLTLSGNLNPVGKLIDIINPYFTVLGISTGELPTGFINGLINTPYAWTYVLIFIVTLIFAYTFVMGVARMIDMESFKEGLNIPKIFGTIRTIGRRNYFAWFVLFILYLLVLTCIRILIGVIPWIGLFLVCLIVIPYTILFAGRSIGLIYKQTKYIGVLNPDDIDPNDEAAQIAVLRQKEMERRRSLDASARRHNSAIKQTQNLRQNETVKKTDNLINDDQKTSQVKASNIDKIEKPKSIKEDKPKSTVTNVKGKMPNLTPEFVTVNSQKDEVKTGEKVIQSVESKSEVVETKHIDPELAKKQAVAQIKDLVGSDAVDHDAIMAKLENNSKSDVSISSNNEVGSVEKIVSDDKVTEDKDSELAKKEAMDKIKELVDDDSANPDEVMEKLQKLLAEK